jgi:hypothetical protein
MLEDLQDFTEWIDKQLDEDARIVGEANALPEMTTGLPRFHVAPLVATHVERFADPARVLNEIDTKRLIIRWHYLRPASAESRPGSEDWECGTCGQPFPCKTLRLLAAPYWRQPGYREEWRP